MQSKLMEKRAMDSVTISWHWTQDHIVYPSWNLVLLEMAKLWIPLLFKMPFSILSPLLTRVAPSFMCHREDGLPEVSILPAISLYSWKKVLSFLDLRYFFFFGSVLCFTQFPNVFLFFSYFEVRIVSIELIHIIRSHFLAFDFLSHLLFLLVKDPSHWDIVEPLPSYGRGIELPGGRYRSLVNGYMLRDVVITGKITFIFAHSFTVSSLQSWLSLR